MDTLVTGNFLSSDGAQQALTALGIEGFGKGEIASFSFAGQDPMEAPAIEVAGIDPAVGGAMSGAAVGGAVGAVVGLVSLPLLGPVAAVAGVGAGAYVGSMVGALSRLGDPAHPDLRDEGDPVPAGATLRQKGTVVAVEAKEPGRRDAAIRVLRGLGASDIEVPRGTIVDSRWIDFDPRSPLCLPAV